MVALSIVLVPPVVWIVPPPEVASVPLLMVALDRSTNALLPTASIMPLVLVMVLF
jgi:hypothetical protein